MFRRLGVLPTLYGLHHFLPPPAPHPLHPHPTLTPSLGLVGGDRTLPGATQLVSRCCPIRYGSRCDHSHLAAWCCLAWSLQLELQTLTQNKDHFKIQRLPKHNGIMRNLDEKEKTQEELCATRLGVDELCGLLGSVSGLWGKMNILTH